MEKGDGASPLTAIDYMKLIGERGHHVMLRYDPNRMGKRPFTLVINGVRICDTDDPLKTFHDYCEGQL